MTIAIVAGPYIPVPPKQYGGIEQVVFHLIKGLKEAGHTPILLGTGDSEVDCELIPITPKALHFPRQKKDWPAHDAMVKAADKKTAKVLRKILPNIDIIHSQGYDMSEFSDFPNVTTLHNKVELKDLEYFKQRKDLPYISISKNQQAVCPELNYIDVVYNGEDYEEFPVVQEPEDYLCFLGRFELDKNPHLAIQLALSLGMKIKLAGKIDFHGEDYFEEKVRKYLHHPLVEYLGELNFKEKVKLLSKAKCNLHPTNFREPFGLTVLEAAYCGTPTLAVAKGSMPELIEPGRTGMLVEDFVEGRHYIEDCFMLDRRYVASRSRQLFNYKSMTRNYEKAYYKVIEEYATQPIEQSSMFRGVVNRNTKVHKQYI